MVKLVPKGIDLSTLRFVSFKIGVSYELKEIALTRDTWPENVFFREFEDNRTKNFTRVVRLNLKPKEGSQLEANPEEC